MTTTKCAIAYIRVSTSKQGITGLGLESQRDMINAFANANGYNITQWFVEVKSGSKSSNRPELNKALKVADQTKCSLMVAKLDRIGRKLGFINNLLEKRVKFVALDMPNANDSGEMSSATKAMIRTLASFAEYERDLISERTSAALQVAKARGIKLGTHGTTLAAANRAEAVKRANDLAPRIKELKDQGRSIRSIAALLDMHPTQVARTLKYLSVNP